MKTINKRCEQQLLGVRTAGGGGGGGQPPIGDQNENTKDISERVRCSFFLEFLTLEDRPDRLPQNVG